MLSPFLCSYCPQTAYGWPSSRPRNIYGAEIGSKKVPSSPFLRHSLALSRKSASTHILRERCKDGHQLIASPRQSLRKAMAHD
jgi:hypothetical protein